MGDTGVTDIYQLTGLDLLRAIADAVGWKWTGDAEDYWYIWDDQGSIVVSFREWIGRITWEDAIYACEAAGVRHIELFCLGVPKCRVSMEGVLSSRIDVYDSDGHSPESLVRALLKALEAKHGD